MTTRTRRRNFPSSLLLPRYLITILLFHPLLSLNSLVAHDKTTIYETPPHTQYGTEQHGAPCCRHEKVDVSSAQPTFPATGLSHSYLVQ